MSSVATRPNPVARALGWSLLLHGVALCLAAAPFVREGLAAVAAYAQSTQPPAVPSAPLEIEVTVPVLTVVPPPPPPESFIRTDGLPESLPEPGQSKFISDRNTRAGSSTLPPDPSGVAGQPSQDGIDIPVVEVIRSAQSDGEDESLPPSPGLAQSPPSGNTPPTPPLPPSPDPESSTPSAPPPPSAAPMEKVAIAVESDIAIATDDEKPAPAKATPRTKTLRDESPSVIREPAAEPRPPRTASATPPAPPPSPSTPPPGYSSLREPTKLRGTISNQGPASVDAQDTPVGRYMKQVTSAVEREWHRKRRLNRDFVTFGTIKLEFYVNSRGQVGSLAIKNRSGANSVMQDFTLNAVLDAKIPPMPAGLTDILDRDRLQISYDIIVY